MQETVGYKAKAELKDILYKDSGFYKFKQFSKASSVTLKTDYDEIEILWEQDLKFRPGFSVMDDRAIMPTIFAKINGIESVQKGKPETYYTECILDLITEETLLAREGIHIKAGLINRVKLLFSGFIKNNTFDVNAAFNGKFFNKVPLSIEMKKHFLEKLKFIIDNRIFKGTFTRGVEYDIINTVMNIPNAIIKLLNGFDFTAINPKLIIVSTSENPLTLQEAILIVLLHYLGFDVLIFAPNGVDKIDCYLNVDLVQQHQIGKYNYNLVLKDLNW